MYCVSGLNIKAAEIFNSVQKDQYLVLYDTKNANIKKLMRSYVEFYFRNGSSGKAGDANPFEEEEWDENDALVDNGEPGVPVKALYDYEGAENDELSFKQGIHFNLLAYFHCYTILLYV